MLYFYEKSAKSQLDKKNDEKKIGKGRHTKVDKKNGKSASLKVQTSTLLYGDNRFWKSENPV